MVALPKVRASNARVATALPPQLVAVFAGATAGIGKTALLAFTKHAANPRIYFIGRSGDKGARLVDQMKELNPEGSYVFLQKDLSSMSKVDEVCQEITSREDTINVLCMTQGTIKGGVSSDGIPFIMAVSFYSRLRMASNLLPLIRKAPTLRRVVSVLTGAKEGKLYEDDIPARHVPMTQLRGHMTSVMTLGLEGLAQQAPDVSFVHSFPGSVNTELIQRETGFAMLCLSYVWKAVMWGWFMSDEECGERHAFLSTSSRYPSKGGSEGVPLEAGVTVALGTDGKPGSGVYSLQEDGESAPQSVVELLERQRKDGLLEKVREHLESEFARTAEQKTSEW